MLLPIRSGFLSNFANLGKKGRGHTMFFFTHKKARKTNTLILFLGRFTVLLDKGKITILISEGFLLLSTFFSSPEPEVLRVSYCDHSTSVGVRRPSICPFTFSCLHSSIYKYQLISTKLCQNVYDQKISDEFDFGPNRTRTTGVICP